MKKFKFDLYLASRIAFAVIIIFVLLQVFWWLVFQNSYVRNVSNTILDTWNHNASVATAIFLSAPNEPSLLIELQKQYPELVFIADTGEFIVDKKVKQAFLDEQNRILRMFAFEGPFFIFVVLAGLYVIAASLQSERELKRRQGNFLGAVSHEFKTPISTLRLLIESLLMRELPADKQKNYIMRMESELSRLEHSSEQVLASARLEQNPNLYLQKLELNQETKIIVEKLRPSLELRGAKLIINYHNEDLNVLLDKNSYALILSNLLDNAVKYSPQAEKIIELEIDADNFLAMVKIKDYGIGINKKERKKIFERFYRVGDEMTRSSKGVGLGLYLVKNLTEKMNAWIKLESKLGEGSLFTLNFPRSLD